MDFINKFTGGSNQQQGQAQGQEQHNSNQQAGGGMFSGFGDKLNSAAGGGRESEKNEDMLDKGAHFTQSSCPLIHIVLIF